MSPPVPVLSAIEPTVFLPALAVAALLVGTAVVGAWALQGGRRSAALAAAERLGDRPAQVPEWFCRVVGRMDLPVDAAALWPVVRVLAPVVVVVVTIGSPPSVGLLAFGVLGFVAVGRARSGGGGSIDVPAVVAAMTAALGSGSSPAQAVTSIGARTASAAGRALTPVARAVDDGVPAQQALDRWADESGDPGARLVADALAVAGSSGGSQARSLAGVGRTIREREALAREIRALGAQARTSAMVLAVTPVAFTSVVALVDGRVASFLLTTPAGLACLLVGGAADAAGWSWMRRLVEGVS